MQTNQYHEQGHQHTFANGFDLFYIEKKGFMQKFAGVMINYGGADQPHDFTLPAGTAHFLEHQLFAKPYGDITDKFEQYEASSNAFTSYNETMYFANFTHHTYENIKTLIELVANPYFTEKNVDTEREIIMQELKMYQDMPDWQLNNQLMHLMYGEEPLSQEVVGTEASLETITSDTLTAAYNNYYSAQNMKLVVVGDLDFEQLITEIEAQVLEINNHPTVISEVKNKDTQSDSQLIKIEGKVESPKFSIGIKFSETDFAVKRPQLYIVMQILMENLFGLSGQLYQKLQNQDLINGEIDFDINFNRQGDFAVISGSSEKPEEAVEAITEAFYHATINQDDFEKQKRKLFGQEIRQLDDFESYGIEFIESIFDQEDYYQYYTDIQEIDFEDCIDLIDEIKNKSTSQTAILFNQNNVDK